MRLVFAGTPDFAAAGLTALIAAGHDVVLVLTQPDRPAGRGLKVDPTPVKALAVAHGLPVLQPAGLRIAGRHDADARAAHEALQDARCHAMIVAAYGLILPPSVLSIPRHGCLNIHASLLPRWRGAAPIQRAIEAGDARTGITIMQMDAGLDTGPMLLIRPTPIGPTETAGELTGRLARLGGEAIVDALAALERGTLVPQPQSSADDVSAVTYATKLSKAEAALDFVRSSRELLDRIRAFDPWPGCTAELAPGSPPMKVWQARPAPGASARGARPGRVVGFAERSDALPSGAVLVATGDGAIALTQLQKAGGKRREAWCFAQDFDELRG